MNVTKIGCGDLVGLTDLEVALCVSGVEYFCCNTSGDSYLIMWNGYVELFAAPKATVNNDFTIPLTFLKYLFIRRREQDSSLRNNLVISQDPVWNM
jgi:hypothetical protein